MLYIGANPNKIITTNEKITKKEIRCCLEPTFSILVYANSTAVYNNMTHKVCFVVPVHYPSFIRAFNKKIPLSESVNKFFIFKDEKLRKELEHYVQEIKDENIITLEYLDI
ncbi:hypothetical protein TCON_1182 [Astathelohania contejeani]|uniref:Uncharacterized protein n=1 Tax=Astathelohania contejeani TaxID=164912 RepID=A0ABQ7HZN1_9MICR|nr:hypothetical protein TCON_1182 [Thelohania contejeani]